MPAIGDFAYGYDQAGLEEYIDTIKTGALQDAKDAVKDTGKIVSACENEWAGKARENFVQNLKQDAAHVSEQFEALFNILVQEVNSAQAAMSNKDEELIKTN